MYTRHENEQNRLLRVFFFFFGILIHNKMGLSGVFEKVLCVLFTLTFYVNSKI